MNKLFSIALIALVFASCHNSGDRKAPVPTAPTTITTPPALVLDSNKQGALTNTPTITTNTAATVALNPEHGAPGHRCDIAVGAPLNSPGSTPAPAPISTPAPVTLKPQTPPQPANNNVRLNPAHGQPGHDCAIPVGQPLKS